MPIDLRGALGGGSFVNQQTAINSVEQLYDEGGGKLWLRSGVIEQDLSLYPDATPSYFNGEVAESFRFQEEFLISTNEIAASNNNFIASDDNYIWLASRASSEIVQYTKSFLPTGFSFLVSGIQIQGFASDGSTLYISDNLTSSVRRFNYSGVESGTPIDLTLAGALVRKIAVHDSEILAWPLQTNTDIFSFDKDSGAYQGVKINVSGEGINVGNVFGDGDYLYVNRDSMEEIYQYSESGIFTGVEKRLSESYGATVRFSDMDFNTYDNCLLGLVNGALFDMNEQSMFVNKYKNDDGFLNINISGTSPTPRGIGVRVATGYYYICDLSSSTIFEFDQQWNPTGFSFLSTEDSQPRGIVPVDDGYFVLGTEFNSVKFYNLSGVYTGVGDFSVSPQTSEPRSLALDGNGCFNIIDWNKARMLCYEDGVYNEDMTYQLSSQDTLMTGVFYGDNSLFTIGVTTKYIYNYSIGGVFTNKIISYDGTQNTIIGGVYEDNKITIISSDGVVDTINITRGIGIPTYSADVSSGLPIYVRVK